MSYQLIEEYTCYFTGGPMKPKGFAIHWWGDPAQRPTFYAIIQVLLQRSAQESASVNFVAEADKVACLVDPFTVAFAQGDGAFGWGNNNLVSIECNPRCTAEDRETVAELIADQHILNGIPIVLYPHKNFTATQCPGVWEQWIPWLTERAKQIVIEKTSGKQEEEMPTAREIAIEVWGFRNENMSNVDAYQNLIDLANSLKMTNLYGTELPVNDQIGHIDKNLNDARVLLLTAIGGIKTEVELSSEDIVTLAETLKDSLAPGVAAELAKRLSE